jgi:hypothetical protein
MLKGAQVNSPNIVIQPTEPVIQKAVNLLKKMDPNYFVGINQINLNSSTSNFGFVESGEGKDPTVVNVNLNRIKQHAGSEATPELIAETAITIAHECAHTKSFSGEQGFVGGESVAEQEERKVAEWIKNNPDKLQSVASVSYKLIKVAFEMNNIERSILNRAISDVRGMSELASRMEEVGYSLGKKFRKDKFNIIRNGEVCDQYYIQMYDFTTFRVERIPTPKIKKQEPKKEPVKRDYSFLMNQMTANELWEKENDL